MHEGVYANPDAVSLARFDDDDDDDVDDVVVVVVVVAFRCPLSVAMDARRHRHHVMLTTQSAVFDDSSQAQPYGTSRPRS
jgi:hypothetical protein